MTKAAMDGWIALDGWIGWMDGLDGWMDGLIGLDRWTGLEGLD